MKCSVCGEKKAVQVYEDYWKCGACVFEDIEAHSQEIKQLNKDISEAQALYVEAKEKIDRYETALKQYANPDNWDESESTDLDLDDLWVGNSSQGYAVAQSALDDK